MCNYYYILLKFIIFYLGYCNKETSSDIFFFSLNYYAEIYFLKFTLKQFYIHTYNI